MSLGSCGVFLSEWRFTIKEKPGPLPSLLFSGLFYSFLVKDISDPCLTVDRYHVSVYVQAHKILKTLVKFLERKIYSHLVLGSFLQLHCKPIYFTHLFHLVKTASTGGLPFGQVQVNWRGSGISISYGLYRRCSSKRHTSFKCI